MKQTGMRMYGMTAALLGAAVLSGAVLPRSLGAQVGANSDILNPNLATAEELAGLPHMNDSIAGLIVDGRPWLNMAAVDGALTYVLQPGQRSDLYAKLFLPINLNEAGDPEIRLVPGVGDKMAHEFEEYRPYVKLAQFRREMGKYVDDDEVARLEQYVFVPIDLNTASREDTLSIPGVGNRMAHEFEEYRPYVDMAQFRREIGKYVDDDEVARLERYVTIGN